MSVSLSRSLRAFASRIGQELGATRQGGWLVAALVAALGGAGCDSATEQGAPQPPDGFGADAGRGSDGGAGADRPDEDAAASPWQPPSTSDCPRSAGSQEELARLADCEEVSELSIEGDDIVSLEPLARLRVVHGQLRIRGTKLASLEGLSALTELRHLALVEMSELSSLAGLPREVALDELTIRHAPKLASLAALPVASLTGVLVEDCPALTTLAPLSGVPLRHVRIVDNPGLTTLLGIEGLMGGADSELMVRGNANITELPAFPELVELSSLTVENNAALASLEGLGGAEGLTVRAVLIADNPALTALPRLSSPVGLEGASVTVEDNDALTSLAGLETLGTVNHLTLVGNDALDDLSALVSSRSARLATLELRDNGRLESLAGLGGWSSLDAVRISQNAALATLAGLGADADGEAFIAVREFTLSNNPNLTTFAGLSVWPNEDVPVAGLLTITDNSKLPQCEARALGERYAVLSPSSTITVTGNDAESVCIEP